FPLPTEANYIKEPIAGLLPNMPASVLGIVGIFASRKALAPRRRWLTLFAAILAGTALIVVAISSFHFHSVTMRYQMDYAPMLLLAPVLGWTMLSQQLKPRTTTTLALQPVAVTIVAWSAFVSIATTASPSAGTG